MRAEILCLAVKNMFDKKWEKIAGKVVHKNPWYEVVQDDVLMPSGQQGKYTYVNRRTAAIVIPMDEQDNVYLTKQYRYPVQEFTWEFPGGAGDSCDESIEEVARRELLEEVGLEAEQWDNLGELFFSTGTSNERAQVFLARRLMKKQAIPDLTEFISFNKVALEEVGKMIIDGRIKEGVQIAAFYFLKKFLTDEKARFSQEAG